jgi:hypothetical protein
MSLGGGHVSYVSLGVSVAFSVSTHPFMVGRFLFMFIRVTAVGISQLPFGGRGAGPIVTDHLRAAAATRPELPIFGAWVSTFIPCPGISARAGSSLFEGFKASNDIFNLF